jgi:hypothetical protein
VSHADYLALERQSAIAGIVGLRNQAEATLLRNRILTYAVSLGREARAAGVNAWSWTAGEASAAASAALAARRRP